MEILCNLFDNDANIPVLDYWIVTCDVQFWTDHQVQKSRDKLVQLDFIGLKMRFNETKRHLIKVHALVCRVLYDFYYTQLYHLDNYLLISKKLMYISKYDLAAHSNID